MSSFTFASIIHHFRIGLMGMMLLGLFLAPLVTLADSTQGQIAAVKAKKNDAIFKVEDIVNQPVTQLKLTSDMTDVGVYDTWFHPGAQVPDFDNVDIRKTQQLVYLEHKYATCALRPGVAFIGSELEFNAMTKYFYTDRSLPKKKLTEDEMLQINQLYRTIGQCNEQLDELEHPDPPMVQAHKWITAHRPVVIAAMGFLLVFLLFIRSRRTAGNEG